MSPAMQSGMSEVMNTGKTPCKYGPVFALYLPYRVQSCKYGAKTGPYLHNVFPVEANQANTHYASN